MFSYYDSLVSKAKKHTTIPSFCGKEYSLAWDGERYSVTLTDTNGILDQFAFSAGNETVKTSRSGNALKLACIRISKTGEVFASVHCDRGIYVPVYAEQALSGAVFEIAAAEDISTADGTVRHAAGELVHTKALVSFSNVRQKAAVTVKKQLEQNRDFSIGLGSEITGVTFGLYAAEELTVAYGLMDIISVDLEGKATCNADLPLGSHYLKELSADEHYLLSQDKYPFNFDYAGQDISLVEIAVNEGEAISNTLRNGKIINAEYT